MVWESVCVLLCLLVHGVRYVRGGRGRVLAWCPCIVMCGGTVACVCGVRVSMCLWISLYLSVDVQCIRKSIPTSITPPPVRSPGVRILA